MHIETPGERSSELVAALVDVWERSVRARHARLPRRGRYRGAAPRGGVGHRGR